MNFKRIEWVFVIAFLGLNIFLFFLYQENISEGSSFSSSSQTESIEKLLENDDIKFSKAFSDKKQEGYYLSGEQEDMSAAVDKVRADAKSKFIINHSLSVTNEILNYQLDEQQMVNHDKITEGITAFLDKEEFVLFGSEYKYLEKPSNFTGDECLAVAGQSFEGIPFNDETAKIQIELTKSDDVYKIEQYTQTHIKSIEKLREKMGLYSEKDAVTTLYTNRRIPSGSTILWTQLAYSRIMQVREKNVYVPVWFVAIKSGESAQQIESVNALTNTVIASSNIPKVASE